MDVTHRPARVEDVSEVLAFWASAAEDQHRPADSADAIARLVERDAEALWLAVADGRIVGSVIVGWDGWRCHVYRLAVHPDWRRRGVASGLLSLAEDRFVAVGGSRADAMVLDENVSAHAAWAATGYARQPEWSRWVKTLPPLRPGRPGPAA